ncbi:hypothetical protein WH47_08649 [Habropoda laboriosa]|uniref:Glycoprotein n=1 Tax=Habropoda laboriosa TaxID=597456 RepID=A0A0L7RGQ8_9HYME|nr:hypothetical protein WH47_08649 [Habropoda laboriosa]
MAPLVLVLCAIITSSTALIGHDCSGPTLNTTTFSIIDPIPCNSEDSSMSYKPTDIQLLQLADFDNIPVIQCRIEIDRTIYYCGMHSHVSVVHNGYHQYIQTTPREACQLLHSTGATLITQTAQITDIRPNSTTTHSLTLAGIIGPEGRCDGSTYADPYGTWTNVVVQALVKITLKSYIASVKLSDDKIILKSGQQCRWQSGHCLDNEDGFTYWETAPHDYCKFQNYDVLYDGKATKIIPEDRVDPTVYSTVAGDTTFALAKAGQLSLCGYTLIKMEHPKLFVLEVTAAGRFKTRKNTIPINNLDIFTYVNTKFVYVEKHIKSQMKNLYQNLMKQRCAMENQVIQNVLTLIHVAPEDVATSITKEPGYLAVPSGEVIHIIKCIPVACQTRRTEECYNELPVLYKNKSYYLTPKNRIITRHGTRRDCNDIMPPVPSDAEQYGKNPRRFVYDMDVPTNVIPRLAFFRVLVYFFL